MKALIVLLAAAFVVSTGCKRSPTGGTVVPAPEVDGSYVGWGRPGGSGRNVRLGLAESDSGEWIGSIKYGNLTNDVLVTEVSDDEDSVRFQYTRGETYQVLGVLSSVGIDLFVLEPNGQPAYTLNKEVDGYNLSGEWDGQMYSEWLEDQSAASLYLDQQGAFYDGNVESDYSLYSLVGEIDGGAMEASDFYFGGVTTGSFGGYDFRFNGTFENQDSIAGTWYVTGNELYDQGTFTFWRNF